MIMIPTTLKWCFLYLGGLLNFCCSSFGDEGVRQIMQGGACTKGGYDLGAWLKRNGWDIAETNTGSSFRRVSATQAKTKSKGAGKGT